MDWELSFMAENENLKTLPLKELHVDAGAKFCGFAGWEMPISYPLGVLKEHLHTRQDAGLFDISHMQLIEVSGSKAQDFLAVALPIDPTGLAIGQSRYNFLLTEEATVLDDLIVTKLADDRFFIVVNAATADNDLKILQERNKDFGCSIKALPRVILALQGPKAAEVMKDLGWADFAELQFMSGVETKDGWFVTRSGYTGEDGFELCLPVETAAEIAKKMLADARVSWIGLGARDSLRLEAGLCLYGSDLSTDLTPYDAALMWAIPPKVREQGLFIGAEALKSQMSAASGLKRVGLKVEGKQPLRNGVVLYDEAGQEIGYISSGGFGPSVGHPVAMGYIKRELAVIGEKVTAQLRGKDYVVEIVKLPFAPHRYYKG